jgi:hypothetical protein
MDTIKKAEVAAEIKPILEGIYLQVDTYGNSNFERDEQIGPDLFIMLMGKIKRWETILYWLYEIDILMGETELDRMIADAEKRYEENNYDDNATRIRYKDIEDETGKMKKTRVKVNIKDELHELKCKELERGIHTEEIMAQADALALAKAMTNKYFK